MRFQRKICWIRFVNSFFSLLYIIFKVWIFNSDHYNSVEFNYLTSFGHNSSFGIDLFKSWVNFSFLSILSLNNRFFLNCRVLFILLASIVSGSRVYENGGLLLNYQRVEESGNSIMLPEAFSRAIEDKWNQNIGTSLTKSAEVSFCDIALRRYPACECVCVITHTYMWFRKLVFTKEQNKISKKRENQSSDI